MFDTYMTVIGNLVDNPRMRVTKTGHAVTNFRIASTSRRFDTEQGRYVDNATLFVNVTCWRAQGENAFKSLHKGQPIVVTGRFYSREYTVDETRRIAYELEANAVGHDLSRGVSEFSKIARSNPTVVTLDEQGLPPDDSDQWLGLAGDDTEHVAAGLPGAAPLADSGAATAEDELAAGARPLVTVG